MNNECAHEYKKTLAKSGMYFVSMCHKCHKEIPYNAYNAIDAWINTLMEETMKSLANMEKSQKDNEGKK